MLTQGIVQSSLDANGGIYGYRTSSYYVPNKTIGIQRSTFFLGNIGVGYAISSYGPPLQTTGTRSSSFATQIDYYPIGTGFTGKLVTPDNPVPH